MAEVAGARVRLRPITLDDVDALVAAQEAEPASFGPSGDEGRERLRRQVERRPTLEADGFLSLGVESEGRLVGDVQARAPRHAFPPGVCEIGITLFAEARGQGLGREVVALFTEYLFGEGWRRVQSTTAVENLAMRRVLDHAGYAFEGVLRGYGPSEDGGREDYAMYAATR